MPMTHKQGEQVIRALQKGFLCWIEDHPALARLEPGPFNNIRHRVFRTTFYAFRLGVVGVPADTEDAHLWRQFFGWLNEEPALEAVPLAARLEIQAKCFRTTLEAFRTGTQVTAEKDHEV